MAFVASQSPGLPLGLGYVWRVCWRSPHPNVWHPRIPDQTSVPPPMRPWFNTAPPFPTKRLDWSWGGGEGCRGKGDCCCGGGCCFGPTSSDCWQDNWVHPFSVLVAHCLPHSVSVSLYCVSLCSDLNSLFHRTVLSVSRVCNFFTRYLINLHSCGQCSLVNECFPDSRCILEAAYNGRANASSKIKGNPEKRSTNKSLFVERLFKYLQQPGA